jgi:hypothetical protein
MDSFFNTVSSYGNSIMANGDTTVLAVGSYKCSEGTCEDSDNMLFTNELNGEVKCQEDNTSCVLNGENEVRLVKMQGTNRGTLILRALSFKDGEAGRGGGVSIESGAIVDIELCVFSHCKATIDSSGGGAIYLWDTTVNIYGTRFNGNIADSGNGDGIFNQGGTITIQNTCPSPYTTNTPFQGKISSHCQYFGPEL